MCLYADREKINGDAAPSRTVAWKVVCRNRKPRHRASKHAYVDGSEHSVSRKAVLEDAIGSSYYFGLHVYTDLAEARSDARGCSVIRVEVSPRCWVAEDRIKREAVYTKLRVIGIERERI